ncbi:hypothetical protein [Vreelandella venusta]|uniref:hypothetical protein n=1 Tax=Vreelandella venusta TaxID=44935 RepID=UPI0038516E5B
MMKRQAKWIGLAGGCILVSGLAGCGGQPTSTGLPPSDPASTSAPLEAPPASQELSHQGTSATVTDWVPPLFISPEEEAAYYVSRLADRRFVSSYGDGDNPKTWYIAAERLGEIGLPAVPLLFAQLATQNAYEQMLVLYALQLATQDPRLMARTRGDYIQLVTALNPAGNAENTRIAQQWRQRHSTLLDSP